MQIEKTEFPSCAALERDFVESCFFDPDNFGIAQEAGLKATDFECTGFAPLFSKMGEHIEKYKILAPQLLASELDPVDMPLDYLKLMCEEAAGRADLQDGRVVRAIVQKLKETSVRRQMFSDMAKTIKGVADGEDLEKVSSQVGRIAVEAMKDNKSVKLEDATATIKDIVLNKVDPNAAKGISTGFARIDDILGGLRAGAVYVLAARPGCGKTSLSLNIAANVLRAGVQKPIVYFSLEMPKREVLLRAISAEARIPTYQIETQTYDTTAGGRLAKATQIFIAHEGQPSLEICDKSGLDIYQLATLARQSAARWGSISAIFIDYLQLITCPKARDTNTGLEEISRQLTVIAKELNIPVVVLSQLNRNSEKRDGAPLLSDLRGSGAIEQDATAVLMLQQSGTQPNGDQHIKLNVVKNRFGQMGQMDFYFTGRYTRFEDMTVDKLEGFAGGKSSFY